MQERDGVELSAKTNLKKVFKALTKEKKEDQARKDQEKAANSVGDGDEYSGDEESRKFLEELRNDEHLKKRRKVQDKDNVTVVVDDDAMDVSHENENILIIPPRSSSITMDIPLDKSYQQTQHGSIVKDIFDNTVIQTKDKGKKKQ